MITIEDLVDDGTHISSTRWAFCLVIIFDLIVIAISVIAALFGHFTGKPIDNSLFGSIALLLGVPTALISGAKISQGYERHDK